MKIRILTLLCALAIHNIAVADDTQALLKTMEAEKDAISKLKGSSKSFYAENCPKYLPFWQQAAEQGQAIAQAFLGVCYSHGTGIAKDEAQAVAWYRKAAEQGYAPAQANLGVMYRDGKGITKDEAQAVVWLRKSAEQGYAPAQINLGSLYANSKTMAKDEAQAVTWFSKAAEQGHAAAQANLGVMFRDGKGIAKDDDQAMTWFRKAEEQDQQNAMLAQFRQLCKEYDSDLSEALKTVTFKKSLGIIDKINANKINAWVGTLTSIKNDQDHGIISLAIKIGSSVINDRAIYSGSSIYDTALALHENQKVFFSGEHLADNNFTERKKLCQPNFTIELSELSDYLNPEIPKQIASLAPAEPTKAMEAPLVTPPPPLENPKNASIVQNAPIETLPPLAPLNVIAPESLTIAEPVNNTSPASAPAPAPPPITAKGQDCLDIAKTGMIGDTQELICEFKGGIKDKFMRIYANENCDNFVTKDDLDNTRTEVLTTVKNKLKKMGEKPYCADAKDYYSGVVKALNSVKY